MMRIIVLILLLLSAQFSGTAFAPAKAGKAWILWPFAADSKSVLGFVGGVPQQAGGRLTPVLFVLAGLPTLGFLAAAASLFGILVPTNWWPIIVPASTILSLLLHILYIGPRAILPILVNGVLLWGVFIQHWSVSSLR
jgi:hypothetical protein